MGKRPRYAFAMCNGVHEKLGESHKFYILSVVVFIVVIAFIVFCGGVNYKKGKECGFQFFLSFSLFFFVQLLI